MVPSEGFVLLNEEEVTVKDSSDPLSAERKVKRFTIRAAHSLSAYAMKTGKEVYFEPGNIMYFPTTEEPVPCIAERYIIAVE